MPDVHGSMLTRRGFCLCCLGSATFAATGGWLTPREAFAQAQGIVQGMRAAAEAAPINVLKLRGGVSVLEGSGGNVAVLIGRDGKLLVDAGIALSRPQMEKALAGLGPEPVTQLINTHWHFDHADGNAWLHELGPKILAHENTRKHLSELTRVEDWDFDFPALSAEALPSDVLATDRTLQVNDTELALMHYGPAHTDGDLSVTFREPDIVHAGDLYWSAGYPFIDYSTGGNIDGKIGAVEAILSAIADDTIVIPGHGPVSNKAGLADYFAMLAGIRASVATLKQQGRSLDETIAARPTADFDARWGRFVIDPAFFTRLVYVGV